MRRCNFTSKYWLVFSLFFSISNLFAQDDLQKTHEAKGQEYAFAMQGPGAAAAAKAVLDQGGNLFDASVAASFAMSVERPQSTGIGGGGFMLVHVAKDQKTYALDFREKAPLKTNADIYVDVEGKRTSRDSFWGIYGVGIPGLVAGLIEVHQKWGKLPFEKLVDPAIELAEKGSLVTKHMYDKLVSEKENLFKDATIRKIFYQKDGTPLQVGETFIQKDLAKSLREIQKNGRKGFYDSWVTQAWIKTSQKNGGNLTKEDFERYQVRYPEPVVGKFNGVKIVSMPPPSSGGIALVQILGALDGYNLKKYGRLSAKTVHLVSTAMQLAFYDRYLYMGDPDFDAIPTKALISDERIRKFKKTIPMNKALKSNEMGKFIGPPPFESTETAHFSMMDSEGNAISTTQSVNSYFGAGLIAEGTGIVMNNTMDDFTIEQGKANGWGLVGGKFNYVAPQKAPVSSMSPTLVLDDQGKPVFALGAPDGPRIITCLAHALINYYEFGMTLSDSVSAVRYHDQFDPDEIRVDSPGFSPELVKSLEKMGHKVTPKDFFCKVQAVSLEKDQLHAFSDLRGIESMALAK